MNGVSKQCTCTSLNMVFEERFGYFVRNSLDRIRNNLVYVQKFTHEKIDYIDDMTDQVENFWIQSENVNKIGKKRHEIKNEERLLEEIKDCARKPVTLALKEFLFDTYPNLFATVDRNIYDFGYDEAED